MKLRNRLSVYLVLIFSVIILTFSAIIYVAFYSALEKKEIKALESKSLLAAVYYLEQDELTSAEHEHIKSRLLKAISRKNIAIYNAANKIVNGEMPADQNIDHHFLNDIRQEKASILRTKDFFYQGIFYSDNQGDFVVLVREPKVDFNDQMNSLLKILGIVSLAGLMVVYLSSQYLGYIAYKPITQFIAQIKGRTGVNFKEPIVLTNYYAEIKELTTTYNRFIEQIAQTFKVQKDFIAYVSHELRTPITALMGTLDVTAQKARTTTEYQEALYHLKEYTSDLEDAIEQMMLLSGIKTKYEFSSVRIDEVIWEIVESQIVYHQADIKVDLNIDDDRLLTIRGNSQLLNLAIGNLVSNAIKYSDNQQVKIQFLSQNTRLVLQVLDSGIGIDQDDLPHIRQNFFRGKNTSAYPGKGIGLSLADIILKLHQIKLEIAANHPRGTIMRLSF